MALTQTQVSELYVAIFNRASEGSGNQFWQASNSAAEAATSMLATTAAADYFGTALDTDQAFVEHIYLNTLNKAPADDPAGIQFWVDALADGASRGDMVVGLIAAAQDPVNAGPAQDQFLNRVAVSDYTANNLDDAPSDLDDVTFGGGLTVTSDPATIASAQAVVDGLGEDPVDPGTPGDTFQLTENRDVLTGTANDDTFVGLVGQNQNGSISNALSTGDVIDGGTGRDKIEASIMEDQEVDGGSDTTIAPRTTSVEEVFLEVQDMNSLGGATLDATRMEGVEEFWTEFSRDDLNIENINLRGSNVDITKDITFGLRDVEFGSGLNANFDTEALVRQAPNATGSQLRINLMDLGTEASPYNDEAPLGQLNVNGFRFTIDGEEKEVSSQAIDDALTYAELFAAVQDALADAALTDPDLNGLEVSIELDGFNTAPLVALLPGGGAGAQTGDSIVIRDENGRDLEGTTFIQEGNTTEFTLFGRYSAEAPDIVSNLIETNLILDNAGRGSTAGEVMIGGGSDSDHNVQQANVVVDRSSKIADLGTSQGTNEFLSDLAGTNITNSEFEVVNITSAEAQGDLTIVAFSDDDNDITGVTGLLNADNFVGDLSIGYAQGEGEGRSNIAEFSALGGGNVTYFADYQTGLDHSINTGAGSDSIDLILGASSSGSQDSKTTVEINTGSDSDVVTLTQGDVTAGPNVATVNTGSGNDTINGGGTSLVLEAEAGDDTIYAENTGNKTIGTFLAGAASITGVQAFAAVGASGQDVNEEELLNGRTLTVALNPTDFGATAAFTNAFEASVVIEASNGVLTTERDLYEAAAKAINEDDVLSKLASASVNSAGDLIVTSLVDGVSVLGDDMVTLAVTGSFTDLNSSVDRNAIVEAVRDKIDDSTETEGNIEAAYDGVALAAADVVDVTTAGTDSTTAGVNSVNAGSGDDVIVLSSDDNDGTNDTIVFDAGPIGVNSIVHFEDLAAGNVENDVLDFTAWLNNTTDASGNANNLSETRVLTTLAASETGFDENAVVVTDFNTLDTASTSGSFDFAGMTDAEVLEALNADASYANVAADGDLVGNVQKSIMLVENNDATPQTNDGEYKVYQVTSELTAGDDNFTAATLIGTLDFAETIAFVGDNFA